LIILSFLAGVSITFYRVAAAPFFMRNSSREERTYIFSLSFGISMVASILGSVVFGQMVAILGNYLGDTIAAYRWTFVASVGLGFFAMIPFSLIKAVDPKKDNNRVDFSWSLIKRRFGLYARLFSPYFVVGTGAGLIIPFLNIYFRDRFDQPTDKIGLFYMAVHTTMLLGILAGPVLVKKIGMVRTLVWTQLASIPFMVTLAFTYSLTVAFVAFLVRGALMNMGHPIGSNFSMETVTQSEQPVVNALLMLGWTGSWMISTQVGGWLIEKHGYTLPLLLAVGLYIVSSLLYYTFFRKAEKKTATGYEVIISRR
jgi:MFS family permease